MKIFLFFISHKKYNGKKYFLLKIFELYLSNRPIIPRCARNPIDLEPVEYTQYYTQILMPGKRLLESDARECENTEMILLLFSKHLKKKR